MVLGALSSEFRAGTNASEVLNRINRLVCDKSLPDQFVTLFLCVLGPDGRGLFIGAGHNPVFLFRKATGQIERLFSENFFLGMFDFALYESRPLQMCSGDILFIYSDGVTDAQNVEGQMFGNDRLLSTIGDYAACGGKALERGMLREIDDFTGATAQTDDITFMVIECKS